MEAVQKYGPNVIDLQLVTGARRWYIVGCYLAPNDTSTIDRIVEALRDRPKGAEMLVAGDINTNLTAPEGDRIEEYIAATIATEGLEDMAQHLLSQEHRWCRDRRTWGLLWKGKEVRFRAETFPKKRQSVPRM